MIPSCLTGILHGELLPRPRHGSGSATPKLARGYRYPHAVSSSP